MTGYTTRFKLPYPQPGDPIYQGADQIKALAQALDANLSGEPTGGGGGASDADLAAIRAEMTTLRNSVTIARNEVNATRTEAFGGADRTYAPTAEITLGSDLTVPGNQDLLAGNQWQALVDTDNGFTRSGTNGQTRYTIPVTGRYLITYQLVHDADNASRGGAMKLFRNGTNVQQHAIATRVAPASLEGPSMDLSTSIVLNAGDAIRWGYWYSGGVKIRAQAFGQIRSKIVLTYTGSR